MSLSLQCLLNPLVQAHTGSIGSLRDTSMQTRRNPQDELAGEVVVRLNAALLAYGQRRLERTRPFLVQRLDAVCIEICPAVESGELSAELTQIRVEADDGRMALDVHHIVHGVTPCDSSHLRTLATAPLSVVGS